MGTATHRPRALHRGRRTALRRMALVGALALLLAGCGLAPDNETPTPFGPGTAPPTAGTPSAAQSIPDLTGGSIGQFEYDSTYFAAYVTSTPTLDNPQFGSLSTAAGDVVVQLSVIFGRPDTPCRYQAALAARDDGYAIDGDGAKRINDQQVEFAEVLLNNGSAYWRLDCAQPTGNVGVQVWGIADAPDKLGTEPVHLLLNSIRP